MDKIGGYPDYYCGGLLYSNVSFWFHFYCFVDLVDFFISSETSLHWPHSLLAGYLQCKVRLKYIARCFLCCIRKGFEAIVMFWGYSDSLVFLLIDFLSTKKEPE